MPLGKVLDGKLAVACVFHVGQEHYVVRMRRNVLLVGMGLMAISLGIVKNLLNLFLPCLLYTSRCV